MFKSHTNLPHPRETSIDEDMERMSVVEPHTSHRGNRAKDKVKQAHAGAAARKRAGTADQFCIYRLSDGRRV